MSENREEHCGRIGGPVYMRDGKPCPECGVPDTHESKQSLRAEIQKWKNAALTRHRTVRHNNGHVITIGRYRDRIDKAVELLDKADKQQREDTKNRHGPFYPYSTISDIRAALTGKGESDE